MKKYLVFLLLLNFLFSPVQVFSAQTDSANEFDITIKDIPPGGGSSHTGSKGLSDGVVTGIVLGSVFGGLAAVGGGAYYLYQKGIRPVCGCVLGEKRRLCFEKADCSKKHIFIKNQEIKNNTYNRAYIENPSAEKPVRIRVTQHSEAFTVNKSKPSLDVRVFAGKKEIPLFTKKIDAANGVLIKEGEILPNTENPLFVDTILTDSKHSLKYDIKIEILE